jgi:beta-glucanase (GH16 family)
MKVINADLDEYHEYSVEWRGDDLIFRLDGVETYRISGGGVRFPEPMFAVLNFAKYAAGPMQGEWVMEVDWVMHEYWQ